MISFRADLHSHTHCSDGTDSPLQLLQKAADANLQALSITDHDTIDAYTPEVLIRARELQIELLPGVELSSEWKDSSVHVLGYRIDLHSGTLREFLRKMIERRGERNRAILAKLSKRGMVIEEEELIAFVAQECRYRTIGRPHIAELMVRKGYVARREEAFERFLAEGALCYTPGIKFTPAEVIAEVHKAGGKAVLAHPHFIPKGAMLQALLALPFDGIECYYGNLQPAQEATWLHLARAKGWLVTGGSDYHGALKPHISLGCSWIGLEAFNALRA